jgi:hypothetical protein
VLSHEAIRIGIERHVEINQINAGVRKNFRIAQPLEIVTEEEFVQGRAGAVCLDGGGLFCCAEDNAFETKFEITAPRTKSAIPQPM